MRENTLASEVKTQQTKTTRKTNFPSITRPKAVIVPGLWVRVHVYELCLTQIARLNICCLGPRFGPDFGVVPVHGYHLGAIVNSLEI